MIYCWPLGPCFATSTKNHEVPFSFMYRMLFLAARLDRACPAVGQEAQESNSAGIQSE